MDQENKNADTGSNTAKPAEGVPTPTATPALPPHPIPPELPAGHTSAPTPAAPTAPLPPAAQATPQATTTKAGTPEGSGPFREDIQKILKDIKLPERRTSPVSESTATARTDIEKNIPSAEEGRASDAIILSEVTKPKDGAPLPTPTAPQPPENAPAPPMPSATTEQPHEKNIVTPLRTLKEDLQEVVREKKISLVRAVALEEEKKRDHKLQPTPGEIAAHKQRSKRTFAIIFTMSVLAFLGAAALLGVYAIQSQRAGQVAVQQESSVLFAEQSFSFLINNQSPSDLKRTLAQARGSSNATLGSITRIVPTIPVLDETGKDSERLASTAEFLRAIGTQVSDDLLRSLSNEFFLGIHTVDKNAPIIVIPVISYDHAFAGMLAWERTMNADLVPAFSHVPPLAAGENGLPIDRPFQDVVMRNYDARALRDDAGQIQLYYSFPTPHILVIAESPYSFTEVLSRLQADRKL